MPRIRRQINPSFDRALIRLADILSEDNRCLDILARKALEEALVCGGAEEDVILRRKPVERLERALRPFRSRLRDVFLHRH